MITSIKQLIKGNKYMFHYRSVSPRKHEDDNIWGVYSSAAKEFTGIENGPNGDGWILNFEDRQMLIGSFDQENFNLGEWIVEDTKVPHVCWITHYERS